MEKIKREDFEAWAKKNNWLQIDEIPTPNGKQIVYLTPSGEFVYVQYDLSGDKVYQIFKKVAVPIQSNPMSRFPIDLQGGGKFPQG